LQKRQYDKAEREFRLIIDSGHMDYVISHYNLGNILMEQCFDEGSRRYHDKAVIKEAIREARLATRKDFCPLSCFR
jgi:2-polyprenyl-6-methoxyphenol hydroxylase-like FAD-dependent oxidoreductase